MKQMSAAFSIVLIGGVILTACAPQVPQSPATQPSAPQATVPASAPQATETAVPQPSPTAAAATIQHTDVPGELPAGKGVFLGDQSTVSSFNKARALTGDRFTLGRFERPYNANTMDVYYPFVDIVSANFYQDATWVYAVITLVGRDANNAFPAKYAVEVDNNLDGRGDLLVMVDSPSSTDWSTDGVQVFTDPDGDVGGHTVINSDSVGMNGDGYENMVFDKGVGKDPDAAWARLSSSDPNSLQLAFKVTLLNGHSKYLAGVWAGTDALDPAKFDLNDHYTHEQAGEANPDSTSFYPIKALAELDNTCRVAIGFVPSGKEPAVCSQGQ